MLSYTRYNDVVTVITAVCVCWLKGHRKKTKHPDSAADELGDWQVGGTSKLLNSYSPETIEHFSAFQSIKHNADDIQEPASMLSR